MSIVDDWSKDPEVIAAIEFLHEIRPNTLENLHKILEKLASYAYKENKTHGDYNDIFSLIAIASIKCEHLIEIKKDLIDNLEWYESKRLEYLNGKPMSEYDQGYNVASIFWLRIAIGLDKLNKNDEGEK